MPITLPITITPITVRSEQVAELGVPIDWVPITPSDTVVYNPPLRAIRCDTGGTLAVVTGNAQQRLMKFSSGETREGKFQMVLATGTSGPASIEGAV